ncbi:tRNA 2'-phosphotransferase 1 isoform X2 [Calypte anna]|uniref:tRNA 2'-phosphotransferase 1 isoform X2 n=1 Tax=Calypte anna TaxID=9244 RepID=UPI0011C3438D|nr:tRNA 2'-phosphotransferase 1 isoform X2 [Calypte anna]
MAEASGGGRRRRRREKPLRFCLSRTLSWVLRHGAADVGLEMGPDGFVEVGALLRLPQLAGVSEGDLMRAVVEDPKGRFALSPPPPAPPRRIRANQGHSLEVPLLELTPLRTPGSLPPTLTHGTRRRCLGAILKEGLRPMGRNHIHLVGGEGLPVGAAGIPFFCSANGVFLSPGDGEGRIPPKFFLRVLELHPERRSGGERDTGGDSPHAQG